MQDNICCHGAAGLNRSQSGNFRSASFLPLKDISRKQLCTLSMNSHGGSLDTNTVSVERLPCYLHSLSTVTFHSHPFFHLLFIPQSVSEPERPAVLPPSLQGIEELSEVVEALGTVEEVMRYLEPERWQVDMEELYKPSWHVLGKSFIHNKKARGRSFNMDIGIMSQI